MPLCVTDCGLTLLYTAQNTQQPAPLICVSFNCEITLSLSLSYFNGPSPPPPSFLTLPAFLLCFYSYSVFVLFLSRSITSDFGLGISSFKTVCLWDMQIWVELPTFWGNVRAVFKVGGPLLALPYHQTVRFC